MNIFVLSLDPKVAAEMHCDKHVVKMCLEYAQLLSTTHHMLSTKPPSNIYKPTHKNHPCAKWARRSTDNYNWLCRLYLYTCEEYEKRYKRRHKSYELRHILQNYPQHLKQGIGTSFAQAMPDKYKNPDPVVAYRAYYQGEKAYMATWNKGRKQPNWWKGS